MTAALWLHRFDPNRSRIAWESGLPATALVAVGTQVVLAVVTFLLPDLAIQVVVWLLAAIALMLYVRQVLHQALLAEGSAHEIGPEAPCPECHRMVPTMNFCPSCGAARAAAPRSTRPPRSA